MQIVQFETRDSGRRLGVLRDGAVLDVTSIRPELTHTFNAFHAAFENSQPFDDFVDSLLSSGAPASVDWQQLHTCCSLDDGPVLRAPLDHEDPHRVLITGTGLTHTGSMESRDQMHSGDAPKEGDDESTWSDSKKMFHMGLKDGKPEPGVRGVAPEWFFKGCGFNLRAHNDTLELPDLALDGGEEPEFVGCYIIDPNGVPRRLGFAPGNEWSDHETENINYLYLAPSKLRQCAVGPVLDTSCDFQQIELSCQVERNGEVIYDSGTLYSGENCMCHSLANCEDHHFKYPQHRIPGDVHLHYFGTSKLSHSDRDWEYADGDVITVSVPAFETELVNRVAKSSEPDRTPVSVRQA